MAAGKKMTMKKFEKSVTDMKMDKKGGKKYEESGADRKQDRSLIKKMNAKTKKMK
jgi:hypothetical protein